MPGNDRPDRKRSARGEWMQKYRQVRDEFNEFKMKAAQYQQAVYELAKSAGQASRRLGMLTNTVLDLRKHIASEPHLDECESIGEGTGSIPEPCTCGHDAILESIDTVLSTPDFEPGNVKVSIQEAPKPVEAPSEEISFVPPPSRL